MTFLAVGIGFLAGLLVGALASYLGQEIERHRAQERAEREAEARQRESRQTPVLLRTVSRWKSAP